MQKIISALLGLSVLVPLAATAADIQAEVPLAKSAAAVQTKAAEVLTEHGYTRLAKNIWAKKTEGDESCSLLTRIKTIPFTIAQIVTCRVSVTTKGCGADGKPLATDEMTEIMRAIDSQ